MEIVWSHKIDEILKIGQPLDGVGVRNWALTKKQALQVLEQFLLSGVSVLGGDVYENIGGVIQLTYDNWHCDAFQGEAHDEFVNRSINETKNYIERYRTNQLHEVFFVFVPESL